MPRRRRPPEEASVPSTPPESVEETTSHDNSSTPEHTTWLSAVPPMWSLHDNARIMRDGGATAFDHFNGNFSSQLVEEMAQEVFQPGNGRRDFTPQPRIEEQFTKPTSTKVEKERAAIFQRLHHITSSLLQERDMHQGAAADAAREDMPLWGSRGQDYIEIVLRRKAANISTVELIDSPVPVPMIEIKRRRWKEFPGMCRGFFTSPDGTQLGWECAICSIRPPAEVTFMVRSTVYCAEHIPDLRVCERCHTETPTWSYHRQFDKTTSLLCRACTGRPTSCNRCGEGIPLDYIMSEECPTCLEHPDTREANRHFSKSNRLVGNTPGVVLQSLRMVGIEVEAGSSISGARSLLANALPPEFGITGDGSIRLPNAFEVQTARIAGKAGEDVMNSFGEMLRAVHATVNESCGLHVHLDCSDILPVNPQTYPRALIQLWKTHIVFEDVILSFLPFSRRRNDYCRSLAQMFKLSEVQMCHTRLDCEKLWYQESHYLSLQSHKREHSHISRYFGVNLHSLFGQKHLEIRYHSGTTNIRKMLEWANLHALIIDAAAAHKFTPSVLSEAGALSSLKEKTELLFSTIGLAEKSREYFQHRQQKFMDRTQPETSIKPTNS